MDLETKKCMISWDVFDEVWSYHNSKVITISAPSTVEEHKELPMSLPVTTSTPICKSHGNLILKRRSDFEVTELHLWYGTSLQERSWLFTTWVHRCGSWRWLGWSKIYPRGCAFMWFNVCLGVVKSKTRSHFLLSKRSISFHSCCLRIHMASLACWICIRNYSTNQ